MPLGDPLHMVTTCDSVDLEGENSQEDLGDEEVDEESQELLEVDENSSQEIALREQRESPLGHTGECGGARRRGRNRAYR